MAVNPVTNKIYVANCGSSNVTVIDGATNATTTVAAGTYPYAVAVNPVTNKVYVANDGSDNVTVINGRAGQRHEGARGIRPAAGRHDLVRAPAPDRQGREPLGRPAGPR